MHDLKDSGARDRSETRAAKQKERNIAGASAWADHDAKQEVMEINLSRQRALRLARDEAVIAAAMVTPKTKLRVRRRAA